MHLTMQAKKNQRCCYCLLLRRLSKISPHTLWTRSASLKLFVIHKLFAYCTLFTTKDLQNSHLATYTVNHIGVTKAVCLSQTVCLLHAFYHKWSSKSTPCHIHCEQHWRHKSCLLIAKIVCLSHAFYHKWSSKSTPCHIHCEPHRRHKSCLLITRFLPQMIFKIHTLPHTLWTTVELQNVCSSYVSSRNNKMLITRVITQIWQILPRGACIRGGRRSWGWDGGACIVILTEACMGNSVHRLNSVHWFNSVH
jgi:hypothetical protein